MLTMIFKRISIVFILGMFFLSVRAQIRNTNIVFYHSNGNKTSFTFGDHPRMTYQNNKIILATKSDFIECSLSDLLKITFEEASTKIEEFIVTSKSEDELYIYNILGVLVKKSKLDEQQHFSILTQDLPDGLYVIKDKIRTYKYLKK